MSDPVPPRIGTSGLVGRPSVRPPNDDVERPSGYDEHGNPVWELPQPPAEGPAIPGSCLRVLHSPLATGFGGECPVTCEGRQEDGSCLTDIVRRANELGVEWRFEVRPTEYDLRWEYV